MTMDKLNVLGLAGKAGAGKDYTFQRLEAALPDRRLHRVALADFLRFELQDILNDGEGLPALWSKPYPEAVRWLLQQYGTEYRRAQDEDYWAKKAEEHISRKVVEDPNALVVVTDVRFANEAYMIRRLDGLVAEVVATPEVRTARLGGVVPPAHASEEMDFDPDVRISNIKTLTLPSLLAFRLGFGDRGLVSL